MQNLARHELMHLLAKHSKDIGIKENEEIVDDIAVEMAAAGANIPPMDELKAEIYEALIKYKTENDLY